MKVLGWLTHSVKTFSSWLGKCISIKSDEIILVLLWIMSFYISFTGFTGVIKGKLSLSLGRSLIPSVAEELKKNYESSGVVLHTPSIKRE